MRHIRAWMSLSFFIISPDALADGSKIDKIYHPYVIQLEREFEYRLLYEQDSDGQKNGRQLHKFGMGRAVSDLWLIELYIASIDSHGQSMDIAAYELELKWQLSEQGQYQYDLGFLVEIEKRDDLDVWESNFVLIFLRQIDRWVMTGNAAYIYEAGADVQNEWETSFAGQMRYRYRKVFEPALEFYLAQETRGFGPMALGTYSLNEGRKIMWQLGAIMGADSDTAQVSYKLSVEFEY